MLVPEWTARKAHLPSCSVACVRRHFSSDTTKATSENDCIASTATDTDPLSDPPLPRVLFRAPSMKSNRINAEDALARSAAVQSCGLGLAFLGIAPFTPPSPFMVGLLLAAFQVQTVYTWQLRQVRINARRHIVEISDVSAEEGKDALSVVKIVCDGVTRRLHVSSQDSVEAARKSSRAKVGDIIKSPQKLGDIIKSGHFVSLDHKGGEKRDAEALETLLSSDVVITKENVEFEYFPSEVKLEADKMTTRLGDLKLSEIKQMDGAAARDVGTQFEKINLGAQLTAGIVGVGGTVLFVLARRQANAEFAEHTRGSPNKSDA